MNMGAHRSTMDWHTRPDDLDVIQILHAAILLVMARLALVCLGFRRTAMIVHRISRVRDRHPVNVDHAQAWSSTYMVSLAAAFVPGRILCLERSLVLYYKLKRRSVPVTLRLGVRAYPFESHAWVELQGRPINETPDRLKDFDPILELGKVELGKFGRLAG